MKGNTGSWDLVVDCHNLEVVVAPMFLSKYSEGIILFHKQKGNTGVYSSYAAAAAKSLQSCLTL